MSTTWPWYNAPMHPSPWTVVRAHCSRPRTRRRARLRHGGCTQLRTSRLGVSLGGQGLPASVGLLQARCRGPTGPLLPCCCALEHHSTSSSLPAFTGSPTDEEEDGVAGGGGRTDVSAAALLAAVTGHPERGQGQQQQQQQQQQQLGAADSRRQRKTSRRQKKTSRSSSWGRRGEHDGTAGVVVGWLKERVGVAVGVGG